MRLGWIIIGRADGKFPTFTSAEMDHVVDFRDTVYKYPGAKQAHVDSLISAGFTIVYSRNEMQQGKAFLDTSCAIKSHDVLGTLYAYKKDLTEKLSAVAVGPHTRGLIPTAPMCLNSRAR